MNLSIVLKYILKLYLRLISKHKEKSRLSPKIILLTSNAARGVVSKLLYYSQLGGITRDFAITNPSNGDYLLSTEQEAAVAQPSSFAQNQR